MTRPVLEFLVVGDPIDHSLSPRIHQAALDWNGIAGCYRRRRIDAADMAGIADDLRAGRLHGVNITMPHKRVAAEVADILTPAAARAGSVNTLAMDNGRLLGDTTDVAGIRWAWTQVGWGPDDPAYVLGAGGAAAAAILALEGRELWISARRREQAVQLVEATGVRAHIVAWGSEIAAVVVNATPVGMTPGVHHPSAVLEAATGVFDMVYGHRTPAVMYAETNGLPVCDGRLMLVGQAAESFARWTGVAPPHAVMLDALTNT